MNLSNLEDLRLKQRESKNELNKTDNKFINKLGYEWRNIYRFCVASDIEDTGKISAELFEEGCSKFNVRLTQEDLRQLSEQYGGHSSSHTALALQSNKLKTINHQPQKINYKKLSHALGLH